jgi:uncharacterized linocin/CFP29 family protein
MHDRAGGVPWTDWQWSRVREVIAQEATKTRVAGSVLPHYGSLPPSTELVPSERVDEEAGTVHELETIQLFDLSVRVRLSRQQVEEEELSGALQLFRRAARLVAWTEDWLIFNGRSRPDRPNQIALDEPGGPEASQCLVRGGRDARGVLECDGRQHVNIPAESNGSLIPAFVHAIAKLEGHTHLAPFVAVLGDALFVRIHTPADSSLVLPRDRIEPLLGGGSLLRSGTLRAEEGAVVSLAGDPIDLAVAVDIEPQFLTIDEHARYVFRVHERFAPRIKEPRAIVHLTP